MVDLHEKMKNYKTCDGGPVFGRLATLAIFDTQQYMLNACNNMSSILYGTTGDGSWDLKVNENKYELHAGAAKTNVGFWKGESTSPSQQSTIEIEDGLSSASHLL